LTNVSSADRPQGEETPNIPALAGARLDAESAAAFRAFQIYRDLGPARSLAKAWQAYRESRGEPVTRVPGPRARWSVKYEWVKRAAEFDAVLDTAARAARVEQTRKLEERRVQFEFANQERLEKRVAQMDIVLAKADVAPVTDVTQSKQELVKGKATETKTKIKGINFSGYASFVRQQNDTARQAITGVRKESKESEKLTLRVDELILESQT